MPEGKVLGLDAERGFIFPSEKFFSAGIKSLYIRYGRTFII